MIERNYNRRHVQGRYGHSSQAAIPIMNLPSPTERSQMNHFSNLEQSKASSSPASVQEVFKCFEHRTFAINLFIFKSSCDPPIF